MFLGTSKGGGAVMAHGNLRIFLPSIVPFFLYFEIYTHSWKRNTLMKLEKLSQLRKILKKCLWCTMKLI